MAEKIRITTAWVSQTGENPWLLSAYDQWTEDAWGGSPDFFNEATDKATRQGDEVRIVELVVDYDAIMERFSAATIDAEVSP